MTTKPDHDRVLDLLKGNPEKFFPTYEIAAMCNIMDNTVHRALDTLENKQGIQIEHKPFVTTAGKRVMSYKYARGAQPKPTAVTLYLEPGCKCGKSFYIGAYTFCCNRCGVNREAEYKAWKIKNKARG